MASSATPLVSVVIPAWNAERWIAETLNSVQGQTWSSLEIILVDDGSTDQTASIVQRDFPAVRYIHQANAGQAAARNRGVAAAQGEFIAFLDSDDLWLPEKIASQLRLIANTPEVSLVFCDYESFGEIPNAPGFARAPVLSGLPVTAVDEFGKRIPQATLLLPLIDDLFCQIPSTWLVRRELFLQVGGYDPTLRRGGEDWLLAVELANRGDFAFDTRRLTRRREVPFSHSKLCQDTPGLILAMTSLLQHAELFPATFVARIRQQLAFSCLYAGLSATGSDKTTLLRNAIRHARSLDFVARGKLTLRAVWGLLRSESSPKAS